MYEEVWLFFLNMKLGLQSATCLEVTVGERGVVIVNFCCPPCALNFLLE